MNYNFNMDKNLNELKEVYNKTEVEQGKFVYVDYYASGKECYITDHTSIISQIKSEFKKNSDPDNNMMLLIEKHSETMNVMMIDNETEEDIKINSNIIGLAYAENREYNFTSDWFPLKFDRFEFQFKDQFYQDLFIDNILINIKFFDII